MTSDMQNLKEDWPNTIQSVAELDDALEAGLKSGTRKGTIRDALRAGISKAKSEQIDNG